MGESSRRVLEVVMQSEQHEPADQRPQRPDMVPSPKASDADRDQALERLRDAFADGRLTEEELDQRSRAALTSRTAADLERLLADLPVTPRPPAAPAAGEDRPVRLTLGIIGDRERRWRWRIARRSTAIAVFGACRLDLRGAKLSAPVTTITAIGVMGGFDVVVPPGVRVESSEYGVFCGTESSIPEQDLPADAPVLRLRVIGLLSWAATKPRFLRELRD
ncbi:MAG TPA: DUF1707 domain-containing protein [Actinomycetes bacterium]